MRRLRDGIKSNAITAQDAGDLSQNPGLIGCHKPDIKSCLDLVDLADPEIGRLTVKIAKQIHVRAAGRQIQRSLTTPDAAAICPAPSRKGAHHPMDWH